MDEPGLSLDSFDDRIGQVESSGTIAVVLVVDDKPWAVFGLTDTLREQAEATGWSLKERVSSEP